MLDKQVLLIYPNFPFGFNNSGAASVLTSRIFSLNRICKHVQLVRMLKEGEKYERKHFSIREEFSKIKELEEIAFQKIIEKEIVIKLSPGNKGRSTLVKRTKIFLKPELNVFNFLNAGNKKIIEDIINTTGPDLIICEHFEPALFINFTDTSIPWVYCHHDWLYKLRKLKETGNSLKYLYHNLLLKKSEFNIVKRSAAVICLSEFERKEIISVGQENCMVQYVTYPTIARANENYNPRPSLVHFGGLGATANRLGLELFVKEVWEDIKLAIPGIQLKIAGDISSANESLLDKINTDNSIISYGHVKDLNDVLVPNDIHIVPWPHPTGSRTRVPVALQFKQLLVATHNAICGFSELKNGINCITVNAVKDFGQVIPAIYFDKEKREKISANGKDTFFAYFSLNQSYNMLGSFLSKCLLSKN